MTWEEIQQMREHNARMKAALQLILRALEWELEERPDDSVLSLAIDVGEAAYENRDREVKG